MQINISTVLGVIDSIIVMICILVDTRGMICILVDTRGDLRSEETGANVHVLVNI